MCVGRVLHGVRCWHSDLGNEKAEFYWIAWAGIACCDVVQHRDRQRIASAIVDEPADIWIMIDAVENDLMTMFGQHGLEKTPEEVHRSAALGEDEWIVGGQPQFVGRWVKDEVGRDVGREGELRMGHGLFSPTTLERPLQRWDSVILKRFGKPCGVHGA